MALYFSKEKFLDTLAPEARVSALRDKIFCRITNEMDGKLAEKSVMGDDSYYVAKKYKVKEEWCVEQ